MHAAKTKHATAIDGISKERTALSCLHALLQNQPLRGHGACTVLQTQTTTAMNGPHDPAALLEKAAHTVQQLSTLLASLKCAFDSGGSDLSSSGQRGSSEAVAASTDRPSGSTEPKSVAVAPPPIDSVGLVEDVHARPAISALVGRATGRLGASVRGKPRKLEADEGRRADGTWADSIADHPLSPIRMRRDESARVSASQRTNAGELGLAAVTFRNPALEATGASRLPADASASPPLLARSAASRWPGGVAGHRTSAARTAALSGASYADLPQSPGTAFVAVRSPQRNRNELPMTVQSRSDPAPAAEIAQVQLEPLSPTLRVAVAVTDAASEQLARLDQRMREAMLVAQQIRGSMSMASAPHRGEAISAGPDAIAQWGRRPQLGHAEESVAGLHPARQLLAFEQYQGGGYSAAGTHHAHNAATLGDYVARSSHAAGAVGPFDPRRVGAASAVVSSTSGDAAALDPRLQTMLQHFQQPASGGAPAVLDAAPVAEPSQQSQHSPAAAGGELNRGSSSVNEEGGWGTGLCYSPLQASTPAASPSDGTPREDIAAAAPSTADARTSAALSRHEEQGYEYGSPQAHEGERGSPQAHGSEEASPLGADAATGGVEGGQADWQGRRQAEHARPWAAAAEDSRPITDDERGGHADGPGRWLLAGEHERSSHPGTPRGIPAAAEAPAPAHNREATSAGVSDELTRALLRLRAAGAAAAAPVPVGDSAEHPPGADTPGQQYGHDAATSSHVAQQVRQEVNSWGVLGSIACGADSTEDAALRAAMEAVQRLSAAMRRV